MKNFIKAHPYWSCAGLAIATDTKEESIIAKMPGTTATAQVRESFIFKVSSEFEGNLKTREIADFLAIKSGSFVKIVNSLSDYLYSYSNLSIEPIASAEVVSLMV
jgi:hypothetical protein